MSKDIQVLKILYWLWGWRSISCHVTIMKALRRSNDELIPSGITMSSFVRDKSQTKGVLPLEVNIAGRNHMTAFFIVDSKTEYNALLGRDWIHQTNCIPSSLYQVLIFWDGKSIMVHPSRQSIHLKLTWSKHDTMTTTLVTSLCKVSMMKDDRLEFWFRKPSRLASETVHQDSARLGVADFITDPDVWH